MASGKTMANQVDLTPVPGTSVNVHVPSGQSSNVINHPTDFPNVAATANLPAGGKAVAVKIQGTPGQTVRFSNPS